MLHDRCILYLEINLHEPKKIVSQASTAFAAHNPPSVQIETETALVAFVCCFFAVFLSKYQKLSFFREAHESVLKNHDLLWR